MKKLFIQTDKLDFFSSTLAEDLSVKNLSMESKLVLKVWTEFECEKCGHRELTHTKTGEAKEWLNHCDTTTKMICVRRFEPNATFLENLEGGD
jgi:hypothetical protein